MIPLPTPLGRSFLEAIQGSFDTASMGSGMWVRLSYLGGLLALLVAVGLVLNHYRKLAAGDKTLPTGAVTKSELVMQALNQALAERSRFDVNFQMDPGRSPATACALRSVDKAALSLEAGTLQIAQEKWVGRVVKVFFHITSPQKHALFYFFTTKIVDVQKATNGLTLLILRTPDTLELGSMRSYLRIEPPYEYLLRLSLWPEMFQANGVEETSPANWAPPLLEIQKGRNAPLRMDDISARGMRLIVSRAALKAKKISFTPSQRLLFLLELHNPETEQKLRLWLRCRIKNIFKDIKAIEVGLQFVQMGGFENEEATELAWKNIGEQGIEPLGNWIMARHLELFRKTGIV